MFVESSFKLRLGYARDDRDDYDFLTGIRIICVNHRQVPASRLEKEDTWQWHMKTYTIVGQGQRNYPWLFNSLFPLCLYEKKNSEIRDLNFIKMCASNRN